MSDFGVKAIELRFIARGSGGMARGSVKNCRRRRAPTASRNAFHTPSKAVDSRSVPQAHRCREPALGEAPIFLQSRWRRAPSCRDAVCYFSPVAGDATSEPGLCCLERAAPIRAATAAYQDSFWKFSLRAGFALAGGGRRRAFLAIFLTAFPVAIVFCSLWR